MIHFLLGQKEQCSNEADGVNAIEIFEQNSGDNDSLFACTKRPMQQ